MTLFRPVLFCCIVTLGSSDCVNAESPWRQPVVRQTDNWHFDLVEALIRQQRFDEALRICDDGSVGLSTESDEAAWWSVRKSEVLTAEQRSNESFGPEQVEACQWPVTSFLSAYPDHRRSLFLSGQLRDVELEAIRHDVAAAAILPAASDNALAGDNRTDSASPRGRLLDRTLRRIARLSISLDELLEAVAAARAQLDMQASGENSEALVRDLVRLQRRLYVQRVELALLESEIFDESQPDALAAAARAERAAEEAIERLPRDSAARVDLERLRVIAALRSGQAERASAMLTALTSTLAGPFPPDLRAVQVLVDLANGRVDEAETRVRNFYGASPGTAPRSLAMDLAALKVQLAKQASGAAVASWIDSVEKRHGAYARRRAEALALGSLRAAGEASADPSIVAAQGHEWLRRAEPSRAAKLLAAAAAAEQDADKALRYAVEAAAAFVAAESPLKAADVLARTSQRQSTADSAPAAHLQAAVLVAETTRPGTVETAENYLRVTIERWPESESAGAARQWLVKLLDQRGDALEAAEILSGIPPSQLSQSQLDRIIDRWYELFATKTSQDSADVGARFLAATKPLLQQPEMRRELLRASTWIVDRRTLEQLPPLESQDTSAEHAFVQALDQFRRHGSVAPALRQPTDRLAEKARWRLMEDGRNDASLREVVADALADWPEDSESLVERAQRLLWMGQVKNAVQVYREAIEASDQPGGIIEDAAATLGESSHADAAEAAVVLWDELAAGVSKGSEAWHRAKLAACRLLDTAGRSDEASRRAQYVLLTSPPESTELRRRYQEIIGDR